MHLGFLPQPTSCLSCLIRESGDSGAECKQGLREVKVPSPPSAAGSQPSIPPPALAVGRPHPLCWTGPYLASVGGRQAALLPLLERALQLLRRAQGLAERGVQAAQQCQAGRQAGQVVAAWHGGGLERAQGVPGGPLSPQPGSRVPWALPLPSPVSIAGSSSSDMYWASSSSSGRSQ